jgi:hypothetical protein
MKALFVFFIIISLFSFSSQGNLLDVYQEEIEEKMIEKEFITFFTSISGENSGTIILNFIDFLENQREIGNRICINFDEANDYNDAFSELNYFLFITNHHYGWFHNIGQCDTVWHFAHGKMIGNETIAGYDVTMETIAKKFPELNHLSNSCRGSYEWATGTYKLETEEIREIYTAYQSKTFNEEERVGNLLNPIPSELGIGNLSFSSQMGMWATLGLSKAFGK